MLSAFGSAFVVAVLVIVLATSFAALVFSGTLGIHLQKGIGLNLLGAALGLAVVGLLTSRPGTIAAPQDVTAAILALAAAGVGARLPPGDTETFLTVVLVVGFTSFMTGGICLILGALRLGDLIRYIPYPVVGGFLAGTGWLLFSGGIGIVMGAPLSLTMLSDPGNSGVAKLVLVTAFAALLVWAARRFHHPLVVPVGLAGVVVLFYAVVFASGSSLSGAEAGGWLLGPFPKGDVWSPWALEAVGTADWGQLRHEIATIASTVVVGVLALLLNGSGIEIATNRDLDLNRELRAAGAANVLIGTAGTIPSYQAVSVSVLVHALGVKTRAVALIAAAICAIVLVFGASGLSLFPRLALGGLVASLGLSLLLEWVYDSAFRLRTTDYLLVLIILVVVAAFGFLHGVAAGTAVAVVLFVVDSSRTEVVTGELSGSTLPSNVDRTEAEQAVLEHQADAIHIVLLQGFLFFGTANRLLHRMRDRAWDPDRPPLKFLVLDFKRVTGIDASAAVSFVKLAQLGQSCGFSIVLTEIPAVTERQLRRGGLGSNENVRLFPDLDRGVQWCEEQILGDSEVDEGAPRAAATPGGLISGGEESRLCAYLEELHLPAGHLLIREGDCSEDLFLLQSGRLTALVEQPGGKTVRLRSMGPGSVVGEIGLYRGERRTASVVADEPSTVYRLSKQALEAMERQDPRAAADLHRMVAGMLAERLAVALRRQKAYTD